MFCIKIAGVVIGIKNRYHFIKSQCQEFIVKNESPAFTVSASKEELRNEAGIDFDSLPYAQSLCLYRKLSLQMLAYQAFLMHGAAIGMDGKAYLFTAASGTGKTTHTRLWRQEYGSRVQYVNGDKPIIRCIDGVMYACGTPWNGKEGYGSNIMLPLAGICFIERGTENKIHSITMQEAIGRIFHQLLMPKDAEAMDLHLSLVEQLLTSIPCYLLQCNMEREAAVVAHDAMVHP